jgi:hypothetical protein
MTSDKKSMNIVLITTILIISIAYVYGACSYNSLFKDDLRVDEKSTPQELIPFSLVLAYDTELVDTEQKCIHFCLSKHWCIGVGDLIGSGKEEFNCQMYTSWQTLGFPVSKCTKELNVARCELSDDMLISIDGEVFLPNTIDNSIGSEASQHILPTNMEEVDIGTLKFCHVLKSNSEVTSTVATVVSDYFGTTPILFNNIVEHVSDGDSGPVDPPFRGPAAVHGRRGSSMGHQGYPLVGMELFNSKPYSDSRSFENYRAFRTKFSEIRQCTVFDVNTTFITPEERIDTDSYFAISATKEDGTDKKYLSCIVSNDDNNYGCTWKSTLEMVWRQSQFSVPHFNEKDNDIRGGQSRTFMAYDNLANELGWLDVVHCDETNQLGKDQLRILHGGKKSGENDLHCGVSNWRISRGENDKMHNRGTFLAWRRNKGYFVGEDDDLITFVREADGFTENEFNARGCGGSKNEGAGPQFNCKSGTDERAMMINLEPVFKSYDTNTLFSIKSTDDDILYCPKNKENCFWANPSEHKEQFFKFYSYGVGQSTVSPQAGAESAVNNIIIYEKYGSFMVAVGYLGVGKENTNDKTLYMNDSPFNEIREHEENGRSHFEDLIIDPTLIISSSAKDIKLVTGNRGEDVKIKLTSSSDLSPSLVPLSGETLSNEKYQWVIDAHNNTIDDMVMCPEDSYLHQIHCKFDQQCEHVDIACVKPTTSCNINVNSNITLVEMKQGVFVDCPEDNAIVGFNSTHIGCKELLVTVPAPSSTSTFSEIGFLTKNDFNAKKGTKPAAGSGKFHGRSFQALIPGTDSVKLWSYGDTCTLDFDDSTFKANGEAAVFNVDKAGSQHGSVCDLDKNQFISQVFCIDNSADCTKGIGFTCDSAPKCTFSGQTRKVTVNTNNFGGIICPYQHVIVGLSCMHSEIGQGAPGPCSEVEITCARVIIDPGFNPDKPTTDDDGDNSATIRAVLIGVGVGLPLLVVAAIVCLCCLPDEVILSSSHIPSYDSASVRDYEMVSTRDVERNNIRRRRF